MYKVGETLSSLQIVSLAGLGLVAGVLAGMFGIGGGAIMVPAMMFIVGFGTKMATGTSLAALLLPFGLFGVLEYYKNGQVNIPAALLLVVGLTVGSFFGARLTLALPDIVVKRAFGIFLIVIALRYLTTR
ncbi:sulfite exporter TauE/SafE family protein [Gloeobacter kilaueensis]|uniref:Probable membrane transporter protein n=1 Tax=Gloeobacter kilaueensis (strain ATCC BAA-2537 / CCAP 1431/1 / ULC 316 / JS1) TaxID=1183438 RepID=U5QQS4_GLOK1|nr:sulfite exporter TauE/SafE family protein [Gloeobacter kilaueensis]AGY59974.1 permease [Gloeobacter kilaueensis JS1]